MCSCFQRTQRANLSEYNPHTIAPEVLCCHLLQPWDFFLGKVSPKLIFNNNLQCFPVAKNCHDSLIECVPRPWVLHNITRDQTNAVHVCVQKLLWTYSSRKTDHCEGQEARASQSSLTLSCIWRKLSESELESVWSRPVPRSTTIEKGVLTTNCSAALYQFYNSSAKTSYSYLSDADNICAYWSDLNLRYFNSDPQGYSTEVRFKALIWLVGLGLV